MSVDRKFLLLLLSALAAAHALALAAAPVDLSLVTANPNLQTPGALGHALLHPNPPGRPGTPDPTYAWRPLSELTLSVNLLLTGGGAAGLRLGSLALHAAACVLAFLLLSRLAPAAARWGALWVAVHPFTAQAFDYVYQRYVLVEACLALGALLAYARGSRRTAFGLALLAQLSKETAVTLPLSLAALEWILPASPGRLRRLGPFLLLPLLAGVQVLRVDGLDLARDAGMAPLEHLRLQFPVVSGYLVQAAFPFPLAFHYDRSVLEPVRSAACGLLLAGTALWIILGPERHRLPRLALALFLAPLALESSVFPIKHLGWNHRCVPGLVGGGLLFGWAASRLPQAGRALPAGVLLLLAGTSAGEHRRWTSEDALSRRDVRNAPRIGYLWSNRAMLRASWPCLARSLRLPMRIEVPSLPPAQADWAVRLLQARARESADRNRPDEARLLLEKAAAIRLHRKSP